DKTIPPTQPRPAVTRNYPGALCPRQLPGDIGTRARSNLAILRPQKMVGCAARPDAPPSADATMRDPATPTATSLLLSCSTTQVQTSPLKANTSYDVPCLRILDGTEVSA